MLSRTPELLSYFYHILDLQGNQDGISLFRASEAWVSFSPCFILDSNWRVLPDLSSLLPFYRNLTHWADNGVLLLNTSLTVKAASAGSHQNKGWENFTNKVVDVVDRYGGANLGATDSTGFGRGVVFLAWGKWAIERVSKLDKV